MSDPSTDEWREAITKKHEGDTPGFAPWTAYEIVELERRYGRTDPVTMPSHYTQLPVECIDVTEHFSFTLGNVIKYVWRADHKGKPLEDLRKAEFYLRREIARREREQ